MSKQPFWEKVKSYLVEDLNQAWLSRVIGVSPSTVSMMITRNTIPRADIALKIADALGVSLHELLGIAYPTRLYQDYQEDGVKESLCQSADDEIPSFPVPIVKRKIELYSGAFRSVPGNFNGSVRIIQNMCRGFERQDIFALYVTGDEMSPIHLLHDDIAVFVNGYVAGNGLYAVALKNDVCIKRLEFNELENIVSILSENQRYRSIESSIDNPQLSILGKVIGWTHIHL
ncbi:MAG: helix-turn-helix domain-containing protein [Sphaerochaetaceae bacterium]|nr:helix-turn-helix domain-containing protein [Sphaerochaetaceae bacterium]MDC7248003.1 helix-turn-helix domain-containing protein [Sphaerochaetaceae bacterium]